MASAQVLPNSSSASRKQGQQAGKRRDLEAGKRRLEEFRKQKAEGRVKKPASTGQLQSASVGQNEKQTLESQSQRLLDSNGAATSEIDLSGKESVGIGTSSDSQAIDLSKTSELGSSSGTHTSPLSASTHNAHIAHLVQKSTEDQASKGYYDSEHQVPSYIYNRQEEEKDNYPTIYNGAQGIHTDEVTIDNPLQPYPIPGIEIAGVNIYQSNHHSMGESQTDEVETYLKGAPVNDFGTSSASVRSTSSEKSASFPVPHGVSFSSISATENASFASQDSFHFASNLTEMFPEDGQYRYPDVNFSGSTIFNSHGLGTSSVPLQSSASLSTGSSFNFKSLSNNVKQNSVISETGTRRTRPSFLDSLDVPRVSSAYQLPITQSEKAEPYRFGRSNIQNDTQQFSASREPSSDSVAFGSFDKFRPPNPQNYNSDNNSISISSGGEMLSHSVKDNRMEWKHEFPAAKQDENFAALEQHIEDLTQEKFSLQRALDASRSLAESLAAENSSLTDSYNQQGAVVNQLKYDLERLQEEISAYLKELESVKMEYTNAQLECNAADERAKILASEVIGLEEKALKLRSSELKLERQLENSNAEIASLKRRMSSLEKERQDFQNTIEDLKEEKKMMQSKLRKASGSGKSIEIIKSPTVTKDASTSMEDFGVEVPNFFHGESSDVDRIHNTFDLETGNIASSSLPHETGALHLPVASAAIPTDQLRTISNISSLITELALEKEELMRALVSESTHSSKLKEMNMELSRKLEAQTQRLELLTAQSMASENTTIRPTDSNVPNDSITYTDEGDEVVERVLGWIMKLFPGGPAKRRTSKLL